MAAPWNAPKWRSWTRTAPVPTYPTASPCPAIERGAGGFQRGTLWHGICVKNGVFVNISDVPVNPRDYCQPLHPVDGAAIAEAQRRMVVAPHLQTGRQGALFK